MNVRVGDPIHFSVVYLQNGVGVEGLAVTVDVWNTLDVRIVEAAAALEVAGGAYKYTLPEGANAAEGRYTAVFTTTSDLVDQKQHDDRALSLYPELRLPDGVEPDVTLEIALKRILAVAAGLSSGMETFTPVFRDVNNTRNAVSGTSDPPGNRTSVAFDDG